MTLQKGSKIGCVTSGVSFLGSGEGWKDVRFLWTMEITGQGSFSPAVLKSKCFFSSISAHLFKRVLMF